MRDDLHRTVPLSRAWRPVMKFIGREPDWERVPRAMSEAVRNELEAGLEAQWVLNFKKTLKFVQSDLFNSDHCFFIFDDFERRSPTPAERQLCEIARGLVARDGTFNELFERALKEVCRQSLPAHIALVESQVRMRHGIREATEVFEKLTELSCQCSFEVKLPHLQRSANVSIADFLNEPISLTLQ